MRTPTPTLYQAITLLYRCRCSHVPWKTRVERRPSIQRHYIDSLAQRSRITLTYQGEPAKQLVCETFKHYNFFWQLRTHYFNEDLPYFQVTQKAHHAMHAAIQSTSLSPRMGVLRLCFEFIVNFVWKFKVNSKHVCPKTHFRELKMRMLPNGLHYNVGGYPKAANRHACTEMCATYQSLCA